MSKEINHSFEFGPFRLDLRQRQLLNDGQAVPLTPKLFDTLLVLVENTGSVITKDSLLSRVWPDAIVEERSLSQNIFLLRKALGEDSNYIETVPKVGYRFLPTVTKAGDPGDLIIEKHDRLRIVSTEEITSPIEAPSAQVLAREMIKTVSRQIAAARRFYNSAVAELNSSVQIFPGNLIASMAGVSNMPFYEAEGTALEPVMATEYLK